MILRNVRVNSDALVTIIEQELAVECKGLYDCLVVVLRYIVRSTHASGNVVG